MDPNLPDQTSKTIPWKQYALYVGIGIVLLDVIILNVVSILGALGKKQQPRSLLVAPTLTPALLPQAAVSSDIADQINQATDAAKMHILRLLSGTPVPSPVLSPSSTPTPTTAPSTREYFVPLGTGFGSGTDWTTITQTGAKVDSLNYGSITTITFEAGVRIPTGNQTVYVRLLNADTFQSVAGSELTLSGGTPTLLTSVPITLATGNHLYQVQLKTQLGYLTYIDFARLRIQAK
ncbi:MAG: hypothetical protein HYV40_00465 [Candidatus Levybacteria bacterium]|nr:hypothetical protein [Candidatus Levybacteria bacterium]